MADKVIISGYLPTRFTGSRSPIRNVVSFLDRFFLLHNIAAADFVRKSLHSLNSDIHGHYVLLGHSSSDTTMVYTTPGMSDLDKAVRTLDG